MNDDDTNLMMARMVQLDPSILFCAPRLNGNIVACYKRNHVDAFAFRESSAASSASVSRDHSIPSS